MEPTWLKAMKVMEPHSFLSKLALWMERKMKLVDMDPMLCAHVANTVSSHHMMFSMCVI